MAPRQSSGVVLIHPDMMIRAFVFDIYNTALEVGPAPPDSEARWLRLWQDPGRFPAGREMPNAGEASAPLSLAEFDAKCEEAIGLARANAQARGIQFPESFWPDITRAVLPGLGLLSQDLLDDFLYEHAQLQPTLICTQPWKGRSRCAGSSPLKPSNSK